MAVHRKFALPASAAILCVFLSQLTFAQDGEREPKEAPEKSEPRFLKIVRDDEAEPKYLQTSVVRYVPASGEGELVVDLIGAVHVGDKSYYEDLNRRFEDYDVVLYELVAPKDKAVPKRGEPRDGNPISFLQGMTKSMLKLESQVDWIDYTKDNFVHADMSPEEMQAAMKKRGEDGLTLALGVMTDMLRQANLAEQQAAERGEAPEEIDPFALMLDPQRSLKLKRIIAEGFAQQGDLESGVGPTLQRMLIDDRNEAAMKVFQKELAKGRKKIAIFYGAAHMPDFEKRLLADFDMKRDEVQWLTAWRMTGSNMGGGAEVDPLKELFRLLEEASP